MALNHMGNILLCCSKSTLLRQSPGRQYVKTMRNFRKGRNFEKAQDESKINPGSWENIFSNIHVDPGDLSVRRLWRPFLFTVGFSGASFVGCAIWEYENMRAHAISMIKRPLNFFKRQPEGYEKSVGKISKDVKRWWNSLTPGQKIFAPICALNILVFAAWRIPRFQPFMIRYFASNPASPSNCLPMILSTFSHYSGFHLLANMYVLHSFSTGAVHGLGKEQFLALYLSAGVISSFTSFLYKVVTKQPGLSLGASGSIMAVLCYVCMQYPDTKLGIILLPFITFSAGTALKFIVGLDTAGVLLGWRFFDHAAHLGGAATGICWALYGNNIWPQREPVLRYWHQLRGSIK